MVLTLHNTASDPAISTLELIARLGDAAAPGLGRRGTVQTAFSLLLDLSELQVRPVRHVGSPVQLVSNDDPG